MKDVTNDETLRGAVSKQRSGGIRMGQPGTFHSVPSIDEYIVYMKTTQGIETS